MEKRKQGTDYSKLTPFMAKDETPEQLFQELSHLENGRLLRGNDNDLDAIAHEINITGKLTGLLVLRIGRRLNQAKKICERKGVNYLKWEEENIKGCSNRKARQLRNVDTYCSEWVEVAKYLPASVLYEISEPSFSSDLRKLLFLYAEVEYWTGKQLKVLQQQYESGGLDSAREYLDKINIRTSTERQVEPFKGLITSIIKKMEAAIKDFENTSGASGSNDFTLSLSTYTPPAQAIITQQYEFIKEQKEAWRGLENRVNDHSIEAA